jgi:hypothetical protein
LTEEEERGEYVSDTSTGLAELRVAALSVVFGDIGTVGIFVAAPGAGFVVRGHGARYYRW